VIQLLSPTLGSITMTKSLALPFLIAVAVFTLSLLILSVFPDTRSTAARQVSGRGSGESEPLLHRQSLDEAHLSFKEHMIHAYHRTRDELLDVVSLFASSKNVSLCLAVFLVTSLAGAAYGIIIQYISLRYGWTLAQV
jgi:hypothetical protein